MGTLDAQAIVSLQGSAPLRPGETGDVRSDLMLWAQRVVMLDRGRSVPELMTRLDQLAASDMDTETRYRILRGIKRPLLQSAARMKKVAHPDGHASPKQRLYGAMAENLALLFRQSDTRDVVDLQSRSERRAWALHNLMRFTQRQLLGAVSTGTAWPPGVWQGLHDIFVGLVMKGQVELQRPGITDSPDPDRDTEQAYKWILLVGLVTERLGSKAMNKNMLARLDDLARECWLMESYGALGKYEQILVEVGRDDPPRINRPPLIDAFRGWVLRGPEALTILLGEKTTDTRDS